MGRFAFSNSYPATGTIGPMFFFPNGSLVFETVNGVLTGRKSFPTMGTTYRDQNADLSDLKATGAMVDDHSIRLWPLLANVCRNLLKNNQGHGFVGLVFQVNNLFSRRLLSYGTAHHDDRSISRSGG
jgi:hypothetical protein